MLKLQRRRASELALGALCDLQVLMCSLLLVVAEVRQLVARRHMQPLHRTTQLHKKLPPRLHLLWLRDLKSSGTSCDISVESCVSKIGPPPPAKLNFSFLIVRTPPAHPRFNVGDKRLQDVFFSGCRLAPNIEPGGRGGLVIAP